MGRSKDDDSEILAGNSNSFTSAKEQDQVGLQHEVLSTDRSQDSKPGNNGSHENGHGGIDSVDVVGKESESDSAKGEKRPEGSVSLFRLFTYADLLDCFLIATGALAAVVHGLSMPIFLLFLGDLIDGFGANINNPKRTAEDVDKYAVYMVYLGIVVWFASWAEVAAWMQTGERQAARIRVLYLQSMLKKDISYFDVDARTGEVVDSISTDTLLIQDAISEKVCSHSCLDYGSKLFRRNAF